MKLRGLIRFALGRSDHFRWRSAAFILVLVVSASTPLAGQGQPVDVIVQSTSTREARLLVRGVGGEVTAELDIIDAVAAKLTEPELESLEAEPDVRIYADTPVESSSSRRRINIRWSFERNGDVWETRRCEPFAPDTKYPTTVGADRLHAEGRTGRGITIAFVDTGYWPLQGISAGDDGHHRLLAQYDAVSGRANHEPSRRRIWRDDRNGHASHVMSVAASNRRSCDENLVNGIAPGADLVSVRALKQNGSGRYIDVIRGIGWAVENKDAYGIRVLSLAFGAAPRSHYWDDPVNQAAMRAWQAGLVVVTTAGNAGPDPLTIGVPGNTPYVITVGAMSDNQTPLVRSDDSIMEFSSAGPTVEGFVKPELVAPGDRLLGLLPRISRLAREQREVRSRRELYELSGTSQSAAVVVGVVALLLEREPWLTPDQVKARLIASADPAVTDNGQLAYSIFQQGAGLVDAFEAVTGGPFDVAANVGLDVKKDLAGVAHYGGRANRDEDGNYYLMGLGDEYLWSGGFLFRDAFLWRNAHEWEGGYAWADAFLWRNTYVWNDAFLFRNAFLWRNAFLFRNSSPSSRVYIQVVEP